VDKSQTASEIGSWSRVSKSVLGDESKSYHYSWAFDSGETGFVRHKKNGKGYKFFKDANGNGVLDNEDLLISKGVFEKGFRNEEQGSLLPEGVDGVITAKPFHCHEKDESIEGMHFEDHYHIPDHVYCDMATGINALGIEHLSLLNADGDMVAHDHGSAHNNMQGHSM